MLLLDHERFPEIHSAYVQIGASGNPRQIQVTLDVGKPSTRHRTSQEIARAAIEAGEAIVPEMQARRNSGRRRAPSRSRSGCSATTWSSLGRRPAWPSRRSRPCRRWRT